MAAVLLVLLEVDDVDVLVDGLVVDVPVDVRDGVDEPRRDAPDIPRFSTRCVNIRPKYSLVRCLGYFGIFVA